MWRAPGFWTHGRGNILGRLMAPIAFVTAAMTAHRAARPGWRAPVPVICCGNVTVGGAGKTTLALDLGRRLVSAGFAPHYLLRGYGGSARGPYRVAGADPVSVAGDEALLLSQVAPAWIGANRIASASAAIGSGANVLVMDDGLQNPSLCKDLTFLVVDGAFGFGNGRVMPAGPLREPVSAAAARSHALVLIGNATPAAKTALPRDLPVLGSRLVPEPASYALAGKRVLPFAGIGLPEKFFATVAEVGGVSVGARSFPDHHAYRDREIIEILEDARRAEAVAVTTAKDFVRIAPRLRTEIAVIRVTLEWQDEAALDALLRSVVGGPGSKR
ncbi:MAG: tetraacyldisaccharide 4'-kinase [Acetobacteraceae bacterium]|nr:tetraacyldisaccharide 4'-kinase [Acetobacteraceae bacterium]